MNEKQINEEAVVYKNVAEDIDDKTESEKHENHRFREEQNLEETDPLTQKLNEENVSNAIQERDNSKNEEGNEGGHTTASEGNNNEDDDDVQIQGEIQSEYSDFNVMSTAEASDTTSAKRGNTVILSGTKREAIKSETNY